MVPGGAGDVLEDLCTVTGRQIRGDRRGLIGSLLGRVCLAAVRTLPITSAATSVMTAAGHRGVVVASDDNARQLEDLQFTTGDGPGVQAFSSGRAVLVPDLADAVPGVRWPMVTRLASELNVRALFAFPLHMGAAALGALTFYHCETGPLPGPDMVRALRLSDAAASGMLELMSGAPVGTHDGYDIAATAASDELYRSEVYQAAGMVTVQLGVSIDVATARVRAHALATGQSSHDVARDIVARTLPLDAD